MTDAVNMFVNVAGVEMGSLNNMEEDCALLRVTEAVHVKVVVCEGR